MPLLNLTLYRYSRLDLETLKYTGKPIPCNATHSLRELPTMNVQDFYRLRRDKYQAEESSGIRQSNRLSRARGIAFLVTAAFFGQGWLGGQGGAWYLLGGLSACTFLGLITWHERLLIRLTRLAAQREVNEQGLARDGRDWARLPNPLNAIPADFRATAADLDLFGDASLLQLLSSVQTPVGQRVVCDWMTRPAAIETISRRQQAVQELGPHQDLRETLQVEGLLLGDRGNVVEQFVVWAESAPWLTQRTWLIWISRLTPLVFLFVAALTFFQRLPVEVALIALTATFLGNLAIIVMFAGNVHELFTRINRGGGQVRRYATMFELMYSMPDSTSELDLIKRRATGVGSRGGVRQAMRELQRITRLANIQHSALFFIFVYLPLQFTLLFDFHVLFFYERWQRRHGIGVRDWFLALGEFESLAALSALHHDNPDWAFPEVAWEADRFAAEAMGHPLLPARQRVCNDVSVGPRGTVLLVTGSNMSGKSTLLRAIGVNATLAQMGGPVCAVRLRMPPVELASSIRVRDSLAAGVSFYMAELLRLKEVVDRAPDVRPDRQVTLLYLLDEILLGTNSRERQIAVVQVLRYLLSKHAIGAVTTHDLELATSEYLSAACQAVHFRETLHPPGSPQPITFDYQLRSGVATTTNALQLLRLVGLPQIESERFPDPNQRPAGPSTPDNRTGEGAS